MAEICEYNGNAPDGSGALGCYVILYNNLTEKHHSKGSLSESCSVVFSEGENASHAVRLANKTDKRSEEHGREAD